MESGWDYDHSCIIINTDRGLTFIDSYLGERTAEIRLFLWKDLQLLINYPDINQWNFLFNCDESSDEVLSITGIDNKYIK